MGIRDLLLYFKKRKNLDWIKLEFFDDRFLDDYSNLEWIFKARQGVCLN